jgi:hypothetical protein
MKSTNGHPLAATLVLISMYAFAWAFHIVTRPAPALPAHSVSAMAALPPTMRAVPPALSAPTLPPGPVAPVRQAAAPAPSPAERAPALTEIAAAPAVESPAALPAFAWSTIPTGYPAAPLPGRIGDAPRRGAVSGGLATAAAAMRSSFRLTGAALKSVF